jgi:hypothetical protein
VKLALCKGRLRHFEYRDDGQLGVGRRSDFQLLSSVLAWSGARRGQANRGGFIKLALVAVKLTTELKSGACGQAERARLAGTWMPSIAHCP